MRVQGHERKHSSPAMEVVGLCHRLPNPLPDARQQLRPQVCRGSHQISVYILHLCPADSFCATREPAAALVCVIRDCSKFSQVQFFLC